MLLQELQSQLLLSWKERQALAASLADAKQVQQDSPTTVVGAAGAAVASKRVAELEEAITAAAAREDELLARLNTLQPVSMRVSVAEQTMASKTAEALAARAGAHEGSAQHAQHAAELTELLSSTRKRREELKREMRELVMADAVADAEGAGGEVSVSVGGELVLAEDTVAALDESTASRMLVSGEG